MHMEYPLPCLKNIYIINFKWFPNNTLFSPSLKYSSCERCSEIATQKNTTKKHLTCHNFTVRRHTMKNKKTDLGHI